MYNAFVKKYPALASDLNTDIEIFPVSSVNHQGTTVYAIWDTGASQTVITHRLMSHLNLIPIETKLVHGVNSKQLVDVVAISIKLPNGFLVPDIRVFVCDIPSPIDLLNRYGCYPIGRPPYFQFRRAYTFQLCYSTFAGTV